MMIILIVFILNHTGIAQNGVVVESVEKRFNEDVFYELYTENDIWDNPELRKKSFLETDLIKLEKTANEIGSPPEIEKEKMYAQKDKFRVDSESATGGKITFIFRKDLGLMYQIDWDTRKVSEISVEATKKMTQGFQDKTDAMQPNIEEMLKSVPPDKRKEMIEALKASGQYKESGSEKEKPKITKTGSKKDINKFSQCEEYRVTYGDKTIALWATSAKPRLIKMMNQIGQDFKSSFGMKDDDDIDPWELLPDKMPVLTITYEEGMMSGSEFKVEEILSAKETTIPEKIFEEYKNPELEKVSMMEMMKIK